MSGLSSSSYDADGVEERSAFIHQELLKLALLIALAVVAFFVTRAIAANNRETTLRDAAEWYDRGRHALDAGDAAGAVDAFRHASLIKRADRGYALALARALFRTSQLDAALRTLLSLRELAPEDAEINLELARLEATRGDSADATRYYHNALYAPWPAEQADARRRLRFELIRFLLNHNQSARAESELVALGNDVPADVHTHVEVGNLFMTVGDYRRALDQFQQALGLAPHDIAALAGASRAAVDSGDYPLAQRYLRDPSSQTSELADLRALVDLVLSKDPLAARIGSRARRDRLHEALSHVEQRLAACTAAPTSAPATTRLPGLLEETRRRSDELMRTSTLDSDTIEGGLELVGRAERAISTACSPADRLDRALILIAERHGVGPQ
jgi:tetratricopeptide (TPR) repeat protein